MKRFRLFVVVVITCAYFVGAENAQDANKCIFGNDPKENTKLMNEISFLVGRNFSLEKDGYKYMISICKDVSNQYEFATVTQTKFKKTLVFGRRNDSHLVRGDSWMVLSYGSGDFKTEKKDPSQRRRASIYIVCYPNEYSTEPQIALVEENGGDYKFILSTQSVCNYGDEISGMEIFLIILVVTMSAYCLIGIAYKRYVYNAQRCQQIPNFNFWSKFGNSLADGCDYICRCDPEVEVDEPWSTILNNFEGNDRDVALLRP